MDCRDFLLIKGVDIAFTFRNSTVMIVICYINLF